MNLMSVQNFEVASDGTRIYSGNLAHTYTYDASGNILTDTVVAQNGNSYRKTYTWTSSNLTSETVWTLV